jgi:carboxypeptidase family protein
MRSAQALMLTSCLLFVAGPAGAAYREAAVKEGGRISGRVRVIGEMPALPPQPVFKQKEVCGETQPDQRLVTGNDGTLQNAVVSLTNIQAGKPVPRDTVVTLDNAKCTFVPHVASATVGQMLHIHNSDPFLHDAHALLDSRTLFNVAILKDHTVRKPLAEPGLIHLNCNIRHTWMHAYLYVAEHPYHAVTPNNGQFVLDDVPPGTYTLRVWHELLGSVDREVTVEKGKTATVDVDMQAVAPESP